VKVARLAAAICLATAGCMAGAAAERIELAHDGSVRTAVLDRVPPGEGPPPLIAVLHGAALDGATMRALLDRLPAAARAAGATLVFPDAHGPIWNDGPIAASLPGGLSARDDVGFLDALFDRLVADGLADPARIHLVGISNGGMMAFAYACARAGRLASLIVFKATMPAAAGTSCAPARPLPVLMVAGTEDTIVRWDGRVVVAGMVELPRRMSVEAGFAFWLSRNGCGPIPDTVVLPQRGAADAPRVEMRSGVGCAEGADTVLMAVIGGGHRLPGGDDGVLFRLLGRATPDADAVDSVMAFAMGRRLR
jgi:polyhydroxybutyrate depolymerase